VSTASGEADAARRWPGPDSGREQWRRRVRRVVAADIAPHAAGVDAAAEHPAAAHAALVRAGLHAPHLPAEYGGEGVDSLSSCILVEEVAKACVSSSLIPNVTRLATLPVLAAARPEVRDRHLRAVAVDGHLPAFALSEPDAGSDAAAIGTRAVADGTGYRITGEKQWITHAGVADSYLVFAVTDPTAGGRGISAFLVDGRAPGLEFGPVEDTLGVRGSPTGPVRLTDVHVPSQLRVGEEGAGLSLALDALDRSRVTVAAQAVGVAQAALDYAADYLVRRHQFGRPIADFQGIRFMVAEMAMRVEAARQLTYAAARESDRPGADLRFAASAAKCFASDVAMEVTTQAVQLLGGVGYTRRHPVERMMRDAKAIQIYEGSNQIQRLVMARAVLPDVDQPRPGSAAMPSL
jgi:alkylation response protein AidB-like acyl-CoA dehydrogenase